MSEGNRSEMESDFLDISGENEDSLLLQNPPTNGVAFVANGTARSKNAYLDCSPLQIPRSNHSLHVRHPFSPIGGVIGNQNTELPSPSIVSESVDKENISGDKLELSRLSVERQQMKRKKKTTGFNLRKSLAWDRAFFTEEGVLDSVELSIVTGNDCQAGGDMLSTIQEERRQSILASNSSSDSPGLRALEENLFKELPGSSKRKEKRAMGGILLKNSAVTPSKGPSSSAHGKKLFSAHDGGSSIKRSGCPRPPVSSSLKRPAANAHMAKTQNKELRVSKLSSTRSDQLKVTNTEKKSTQGQSRTKQILSAQSNSNSQRSLASTSSSKKTPSTQTKTKPNLASKASIPKPSINQARRNMVSAGSDIPSSSSSQQSATLPVHTLGSTFHDYSSSNMAVSGSSRVPKPSGLKMPSPSIGFFSQSRYPSNGSLEQGSRVLSRSGISYSATNRSLIPTFKKAQSPGKVFPVNNKSTTDDISGLVSTTDLSADLKSPPKEEFKLQNLQHPSVNAEGTASVCKYEKNSSEEDEEMQSNNKTLPLYTRNNRQEDKTGDNKGDEIGRSCTTEEDQVQCSGDEKLKAFDEDSQSDVSIQGEGMTCKKKSYNGDLDRLGDGGPPLNTSLLLEDEDRNGICISVEKGVSDKDISVEVNDCIKVRDCEDDHVIDVMTGSGKADEDNGNEMRMECVTGSPVAEHNTEDQIPTTFSANTPVSTVVCSVDPVIEAEEAINNHDEVSVRDKTQTTLTTEAVENVPDSPKESSVCREIQDVKPEKRPEPVVVKPPLPNAVPFSDEWLAAIESAGEEILTLKTGPVQHSPPVKPAYQPGPWSPVKRKNHQGVGPFDCTKFTNKGLPPSS